MRPQLPYCGDQIRRYDRDRFLTALFAPADRRGDLFALYAFNLEVAKTREVVTEPMLGRIRLQWWRDALDEVFAGEPPRQHAVLEPLADAIHRHALPRPAFDRLIDAREQDLGEGPPADLDALRAYARDSGGSLASLAALLLGAVDGASRQAADEVGTAQALAGLLVAVPFRARRGRVDLPGTLLEASGVDPAAIRELTSGAPLRGAVEAVADAARQCLVDARAARRRIARQAVPALLPALVAERNLKRLRQAGYDPYSPEIARPDGSFGLRLALAAWRGTY